MLQSRASGDEGKQFLHSLESFLSLLDLGGGSCELTPSQRNQFYDGTTRVWTLNDAMLDELQDDVQSIVLCAAPNDTILFSTNRTILPQRSIVISKNLTLSSQGAGPLVRDGNIAEAEMKVKLTCPVSGDLLSVR